MKTIQQIMAFRPQLTVEEHGKEAPLSDILHAYYKGYDMSYNEASEAVDAYVKALEAFVAGKVCK